MKIDLANFSEERHKKGFAMTIIFSNNMDPDCQVIKQAWQDLKDINLVEITPDTDDYEDLVNNAIIAEDDTIMFVGHGTSKGLLFPNLNRMEYLLHEFNANLVHAKNIICCWCFASDFVISMNWHNTFATSMFISNIREACDNSIIDYTQKQINSNGERFFCDINQLIKNKVPLNDWIMQLGAKMDIENVIDTFNRQGLYYNK